MSGHADLQPGSVWEMGYRVLGRSAVWPDLYVCEILFGLDKGKKIVLDPDRLYKEARYQDGESPHNKVEPPHRSNGRGHDTEGEASMPDETNNLHVRVSYATDCPEWWRISLGRRLGKPGSAPATRAECVAHLRRFGESEDDNLAREWTDLNDAIAKGEQVYT